MPAFNLKGSTMKPVRVRFAPSPTGSLHLGGARTALYNYLFAKHHGGQFIVRVEDTDAQRSSAENMRTQLRDLHWLGLQWEEGIDAQQLLSHGAHAPYRQSERLAIYREYADRLLANGQAYYCFLSDAQIDAQREQAKKEKRPYQVHSPYRDLPLAEAQAKLATGEIATVRFKTPIQPTDYHLTDMVRGDVTFPSNMVADFVILRATGMPVYNFCCVIDDALMAITHVFRGEEHLPNTLRQLMLYEAFDMTPPQFGHLSIILGDDKKKLSKRQGAVSCDEFRAQGFLPQALLNYIALLGWSDESGRDIFSLPELCEAFSATRLNAAAAVFDRKKLLWVNSQHIRRLPADELWAALQPWFAKAQLTLPEDKDWQQKSLALFTPNLTTLSDAIDLYRPFAKGAFQISEEANEVLTWPTTPPVIQHWIEQLQTYRENYLTQQDLQTISEQLKQHCQVKGKPLFMPLRVAMLGKPQGAELKLLVELLPRTQLIERAQQALTASEMV
jgi:nondiscriminating glutamyl-tRNA synthetase